MEKSTTTKPKLGILGGLGVQVTNRFCKMITEMQTVEKEQDYLDMLVYYKPSVSDRTAFLLGESEDSPLEYLIDGLKTLEDAGCTCIALPCTTSHYFYDKLQASVNVPLLNIVDETVNFILSNEYRDVGLLATTGTLTGGFFAKALKDNGIYIVIHDAEKQALLMEIVYNVKHGNFADIKAFKEIISNLKILDCEAVILGCTELSLFADDDKYYIDSLRLLAKAALEKCK